MRAVTPRLPSVLAFAAALALGAASVQAEGACCERPASRASLLTGQANGGAGTRTCPTALTERPAHRCGFDVAASLLRFTPGAIAVTLGSRISAWLVR